MKPNKMLPDNLHVAYEWTRAAGELEELRSLDGGELDRYCAESEQNARNHRETDVCAADLLALHDWLKDS
jgi:hypothetical protein